MERWWDDIDRGDEVLMVYDRHCTYDVTMRRVRTTTLAFYRH